MCDYCVICGDPHTHLHHALPKSVWPEGRHEPLNFIRLCFHCHMGWHSRQVTVTRDIFKPMQWEWISARASDEWLDTWYPPRPADDVPF